jgi:hypothetical protein
VAAISASVNCALGEVTAHRTAYLVGTVDDLGDAEPVVVGLLGKLVLRTQEKIAVPGRLRNVGRRRINTGPIQHARIDGFFQPVCHATHIAHRCESVREPFLCLGRGARRDLVPAHAFHDVDAAIGIHVEVRMAVDQSRHQCAPAAVDNRGAGASFDLAGRDCPDQVAFDQHLVVFVEPFVGTVEDIDVCKQCLRW